MINWTISYCLSQILVILAYILIAITYFLKKRKQILSADIFSHIAQAASYALLNGLTGVAMNLIYIFRDTFFVINEKNSVSKKITKKDIYVLVVLILIIFISTLLTYNGWKSLLSVLATLFSTVAIWQKKTKIYKILGIPTSILWLAYNVCLKSLFGIILETILLVSIVFNVIRDRKLKQI